MEVKCFVPLGFDGSIVSVETDLRKTIPGFDIVGLPDGAVREARERVRTAIRNCGFKFPKERILINLSPAGVRKAGAGFDLAIACAVLAASRQINFPMQTGKRLPILILGELNLSGSVCPVNGVISAVLKAAEKGIRCALVPEKNVKEAEAPGCCRVSGIGILSEVRGALDCFGTEKPQRAAAVSVSGQADGVPEGPEEGSGAEIVDTFGDIAEIKGHRFMKRALEVAAAGRHNLFLFGPPGSGKSMAARRFPSLLPPLSVVESLEVTKIHSLAGKLHPGVGLIFTPPFRMPHHSASQEGIIGGGQSILPGEISLAHSGVLFIDEAPEFKKNILQSMREPIEVGWVHIVRAGQSYWFPADFQLIMAANPCPCGNLGRDEKVCMCSTAEIERYWRRIGGALLDRIDIRVPLKPVSPETILEDGGEGSFDLRKRIDRALVMQRNRSRGASATGGGRNPHADTKDAYTRNGRIPSSKIREYCRLSAETKSAFTNAVDKLGLSSRACHSVLKVARTVADLEESEEVKKIHILEAVQHRRYGDGDYFWSERF